MFRSISSATLLSGISLVLMSGTAPAASPKEIDLAIKKGTDWLKANCQQAGTDGGVIGPICLAGLAMLEGGVPPADPALKSVAETIRNASYSQTRTYQISLCLMFLDRLSASTGEIADVPLIQILAVRLLAGQTAKGGWGYDCIQGHQAGDPQQLRAIKAVKQQGQPKMYPEVEQYAQAIATSRAQAGGAGLALVSDDNSNTQFGVIAVWMARKHGVSVDNALKAIETRFMNTQTPTGHWGYFATPSQGASDAGSPAMFCAGLIGLSTALALREERRNAEHHKKEEPPKKEPGSEPNKATPDDPFFNPPAKSKPEPKKAPPSRPLDERDQRVKLAFAGLGQVLAQSAQAGQGALVLQNTQQGHNDLYFYWSLERTCVIYGVEKVGGVDWYEAGAQTLVANQAANGSWTQQYGAKVCTSFAVLFLCRSNLARDLSGKVQNTSETTMRAGAGPGNTETKSGNAPGANPNPTPSAPVIPDAAGNEASALAFKLVRSTEKDWSTLLRKLRDSKGSTFTEALVTAANRLEGDRLKQARDALAERLTRMTANTLRAMAKSDEPELRRGAYLAMAMKEDKSHIPDLIAGILDDEEVVIRAAKAGLVSLSGEDLGPAKNANIGEKKLAKDAWQNWWDKQKK